MIFLGVFHALFIPISHSNFAFLQVTTVCARGYCNLPLPVYPVFGIDQDIGAMITREAIPPIQLRLFITPFHCINQCRYIMRCFKLRERRVLVLSTYLRLARGCLYYNVD